MLSNQTCTNPTGYHRRQRSTPTLPIATRPTIVTRLQSQQQSRAQGEKLERFFQYGTQQDSTIQGANDRFNGNNGQQEQHQTVQETRQDTVRPGQSTETEKRNSIAGGDINGSYLSSGDFEELMKDVQPHGSAEETSSWEHAGPLAYAIDASGQIDGLSMGNSFHEASQSAMATSAALESNTHHNAAAFPEKSAEIRAQLPQTPKRHTIMGQLPMTPGTSPFMQKGTIPRSDETYEDDGSPTKQTGSHPMQRGRSYQEDLAAMRQHVMSPDPMSPPKAASLQRRSVDFAIMPSPKFLSLCELKKEMPTSGGGYDPAIYSPIANAMPPSSMGSFQSSPEMTSMSLFESAEVDNAVMDAKLAFLRASRGSIDMSAGSSPTLPSPHHHGQSVSDIDLEECVENTGITNEEISSFIQGPFPEDQKWRCLFQEHDGPVCGKRFARKENARSHVQTHLGDRQYVCKVCKTKFVRQHDLKRHFKIHTTDKPHKCPCGKDFHRHDALTRHRQRGMCIGAFDNSPKRSVKRGRPKKTRPDTEERIEKAAKTRRYVLERTRPGSTYASSISGSSESHGSPPCFDSASIGGSSPSLSQRALQDMTFASQSFGSNMTPPTSPGYSPVRGQSSVHSQNSHTPKANSHSPSPKITSIPEEAQNVQHEFRGSEVIDFNHSSPPELDLSGSSPATSNFYDFIGNGTGVGADGLDDARSGDRLTAQLLNGDFSLFNGTDGKMITSDPTATSLDDFLNMSGIQQHDPAMQTKHDQTNISQDPIMGQGTFNAASMKELDDIFDGL